MPSRHLLRRFASTILFFTLVLATFLPYAFAPFPLSSNHVGSNSVTTPTFQTGSHKPIFFSQTRYWIIMRNNTEIRYQSSTDGITWAASTLLFTIATTAEFDVWYDPQLDRAHIALLNTTSTILYRRYTLSTTGVMTQEAASTAATAISGVNRFAAPIVLLVTRPSRFLMIAMPNVTCSGCTPGNSPWNVIAVISENSGGSWSGQIELSPQGGVTTSATEVGTGGVWSTGNAVYLLMGNTVSTSAFAGIWGQRITVGQPPGTLTKLAGNGELVFSIFNTDSNNRPTLSVDLTNNNMYASLVRPTGGAGSDMQYWFIRFTVREGWLHLHMFESVTGGNIGSFIQNSNFVENSDRVIILYHVRAGANAAQIRARNYTVSTDTVGDSYQWSSPTETQINTLVTATRVNDAGRTIVFGAYVRGGTAPQAVRFIVPYTAVLTPPATTTTTLIAVPTNPQSFPEIIAYTVQAVGFGTLAGGFLVAMIIIGTAFVILANNRVRNIWAYIIMGIVALGFTTAIGLLPPWVILLVFLAIAAFTAREISKQGGE